MKVSIIFLIAQDLYVA